MSDENIYTQARKQKMTELAASGISAYPQNIKPTHLAADVIAHFDSKSKEELEAETGTFAVAGRVIFERSFGKAGFLKLKDRSGALQIYCDKQTLGDSFTIFKKVDIGDFIWAKGTLFRTKTDELTLKVEEIRLAAKSLRPLPEKWHGLKDIEARYRQRYVDLIVNAEVVKTFRIRSQVLKIIRDFFVARDYLEVETPMMHSIPGGAVAKPFVTFHNKLDMELFLRVAPELFLKRLVVGGLERVFEIGRNFRNEGISTQHNPEFTMLEFYEAYATFEDLMAMTEQLFEELAKKIVGSGDVVYQGETLCFKAPFNRLTMKEAVKKFAGVDPESLSDKKLLEVFENEVEGKLVEPTFIIEFPTSVSPLARRNEKNPEFADRFELFIFGREIANGFNELNDPQDQAERFKAQVEELHAGNEEAMHFDEDYIDALEIGMPPTAGEGIGIDRLVMLLADAPSIRDVILFPQLKKKF